jgi:hypothetical protein
MALWRYRRGGMLAGLKKLDRDVFRGRVALYGVNASANLQQMFVPFYHGILCMIAMAGMRPERMAALRPGQRCYSTRLYGRRKMRMIVRNMCAISDHARRGRPENRLSFACITIASIIAHCVRAQIILTQTIPFPRRLDCT